MVGDILSYIIVFKIPVLLAPKNFVVGIVVYRLEVMKVRPSRGSGEVYEYPPGKSRV